MQKSNKPDSVRTFRWRKSSDTSVELSERDGVRSLHLGSDLIQSAMRIARPYDLEVAYTQCMMGFLLFDPQPKDVVMVGLGGGSLAKFIHHRLPATSTITVEINSQVIAAARNFFFLPAEEERFRIVLADGAEYVASHPASCDVLMVDGYEDGTMPEALGSQTFYEHAAMALRPTGILVMNLLGRDKRLGNYIDSIKDYFPGGSLRLQDSEHGNIIIFAFRQPPDSRCLKMLQRRAVELEEQYGLPFTSYAKDFVSDCAFQFAAWDKR